MRASRPRFRCTAPADARARRPATRPLPRRRRRRPAAPATGVARALADELVRTVPAASLSRPSCTPLAIFFSSVFFLLAPAFLSLLAWNFICISFLCLGLFAAPFVARLLGCVPLSATSRRCRTAFFPPSRLVRFSFCSVPHSHSLSWPPLVPRAPWIWPPASSSASKPSVPSPPHKPRRRAAVPPRRPPPPLRPPRPRRWRRCGRLLPPPARHRPRRTGGASLPAAAGMPRPAVAPPPRAARHHRAAGAPRRPPADRRLAAATAAAPATGRLRPATIPRRGRRARG